MNRTPQICTDGQDIRYCARAVHHRHEDGRWVHSREAAATIYIDAYPCAEFPTGIAGPYTPRELGYMGRDPDGTTGDEMRHTHRAEPGAA